MTTKEVMVALAPTIHERLRAGEKLVDLYAIVRAKLPQEARLTQTSFKRYWQDARQEIGLAPIKTSGRKGPRPPAVTVDVAAVVTAAVPSPEPNNATPRTSTASDFRTDSEEF
ncbi:hypothetical protein [Pseudorhodobacter turbinis]|nr:hypothetical protein [Pseudorhodobacter turbinis]